MFVVCRLYQITMNCTEFDMVGFTRTGSDGGPVSDPQPLEGLPSPPRGIQDFGTLHQLHQYGLLCRRVCSQSAY